MTEKRRTHSPEFQARIALEVLKGIKLIHEITSNSEIPPVQVLQWKMELQNRMAELFECKNARSEETPRGRLERKVEHLTIELDWFSKKSKKLGVS